MKKPIFMISLFQKNRGIGYLGKLLHRIREDQEYFKQVTMGHIVMMGYKTWKDIPESARPLEGRINVVITREHLREFDNMENVFAFADMDRAMAFAQNFLKGDFVWIIGGQALYEHFLPVAEKIYATETTEEIEDKPADRFFPDFKKEFPKKTKIKDILSHNKTLRFEVNLYERIAA